MEQEDSKPIFQVATDQLNGTNHLASGVVVDRQIRAFIANIMLAKSEDEVMEHIERFSRIFAGMDQSFIQRLDWHNRAGLGRSLAEHYHIDDEQPFFDIVRTAFLTIAENMFSIVAKYHTDDGEMKRRTEFEINRALAIFTGAADAGAGITEEPR